MIKALCQILLAGAVLVLFPLTLHAQEITVRTGIHPGFGRIVFDWPREVSFQARIDNQLLILEFGEAADYQFGRLEQGMKGFTGRPTLDSTKKKITFPLLDDYSLKTLTAGTKIIVDLLAETVESAVVSSPSDSKTKTKVIVPQIGFRFAEHPDYNRLVFDWPENAQGSLTQTGNKVTVQFNNPGNVDLSKLNKQTLPYIKRGRVIRKAPGLSVEFDLQPGSSARLFAVGTKSVVDVKSSSPKKEIKTARPKIESKDKSKELTAEVPTTSTKGNVKPIEPEYNTSTPKKETGSLKVTPKDASANAGGDETVVAALPKLEELAGPGPLSLLPKPAGDQTPEPKATGKKENSAKAIQGGKKSKPVTAKPVTAKPVTAKPVIESKQSNTTGKKRLASTPIAWNGPTRLSDFKLVDDDKAETETEAETEVEASSENQLEQDLVTLAEPFEIPNILPPPGRSANLLPPTILNFNWKEPTGAVVFRRGEHLWLVFDKEGPDNLASAIEALVPYFAPVDVLPVAGATVIRLTAPVTQVPRMSKDGNAWTIDIRRRSTLPVQAISSVLGKGKDGPEVKFLVKSVSRLLSLSHPELGDRLIVAPIGEANLGLAKIDEFPQFRALPSYQGVVLQPTAEGLVVALTSRAVVVRSRGELYVSGETARSLPRGVVASPVPSIQMLDLNADRLGSVKDYRKNLQDLQRTVIETTGMEQGIARFDLARFFFAHGRITEAVGMLNLIAQENRRISDDPAFKLLLGASQFLSDRFDEAQKTLSNAALAGEWEANLWQAALAASGQDWGPAAIGFSETLPLIKPFPSNIRNKLYLLAAEANLQVGDTGAASRLLSKVSSGEMTDFEQAQVKFLEGQRLLQDGIPEEAKVIWKGLKYNRHRPSSARARLALALLGMDEGTLTEEEGIEQLEQLRFAWRGDKFEFAILNDLGDRYADSLNFRKSLHSLRQAASYFPQSERADKVAKRMKEIFEGMYLEDGGRQIPPLSSISLYEEFKELTPIGEKGDTMIAKLADRLVDVDLLEQAGNLLDEQVDFRLEGEEKGRVGSRLALIRLLDRSPEKSITALDKTDNKNLSEGLKNQRLHLRARALAEMSREREALELLARDESLDSLRLKADILWKLRRWDEVGDMLGKLIPGTPPVDRPLSEKESQAVLNLAIAQTMGSDNEGLKILRRSYGPVMEKGPHNDTFKLLTAGIDRGSITSIADELKKISQVQAFMDQYKSKLKNNPLSEIN